MADISKKTRAEWRASSHAIIPIVPLLSGWLAVRAAPPNLLMRSDAMGSFHLSSSPTPQLHVLLASAVAVLIAYLGGKLCVMTRSGADGGGGINCIYVLFAGDFDPYSASSFRTTGPVLHSSRDPSV
ncbi:uncharacterized protein J3D65DRAFT_142927 [Phyllosticta citribraziliensis]|uniref:Uncharacterized protein n=1 Tax=Phyllosticta citribraziliensis TaxID=989973 RepID=A0ABR1L6U3_9PEZI